MSSRAALKAAAPVLARVFEKIPGAPEAYVSRPKEDALPVKDGPDLIILFGWMDGQLPHLFKYTEAYHKEYPGATQILIRSHGSFWWTSTSASIQALLPVATLLQELKTDNTLVHIASNGGSFMLVTLADAIALTDPTKTPLVPCKAVIHDSNPGKDDLLPALEAFTGGIKNPLIKLAAKGTLLTFLVTHALWGMLMRKPDPTGFETMRQRLLDPAVLPHTAVRTYIYSNADRLVSHEAVEEHIAEAKRAGLDVVAENFGESLHVSHARTDPPRYWDIVRRTWARISGH
ncbi:hypothetical protein FRB99_002405 [Tulasnella sp. 403]|nr:hypothetical protein FRB99_002405 [Tulasnella sp. 403]